MTGIPMPYWDHKRAIDTGYDLLREKYRAKRKASPGVRKMSG